MPEGISSILKSLQDGFGIEASPALQDAAVKFPRASFASKFFDDRNGRWLTANDDPAWQSLVAEDRFLPIQVSVNGEITSSISQPSLVLAMIEKLDLDPGHRVLEIGTASGWSAALMSSMVGPEGEIVTAEISSELYELAKQNLEVNDVKNVQVINVDGSQEIDGGPFDRIIYTVGARDFSPALINLLSDHGKVVIVHKFDATADVLYSGEKKGDSLYLEPLIPVIFVEMLGKLEGRDSIIEIDDEPDPEISRPFWGDVSGSGNLIYKTAGLRFFMRNCSSHYSQVKCNGVDGFGIVRPLGGKAVVIEGSHHVKGDRETVSIFFAILEDWARMGLPGLTAFDLRVSVRCNKERDELGYDGSELRYDYFLRTH